MQDRAIQDVQQIFLLLGPYNPADPIMEGVLVVEKKMLVEPTKSPSGIITMQVPGILEQGQAICSGGFYAIYVCVCVCACVCMCARMRAVFDVLLGPATDRMFDSGESE